MTWYYAQGKDEWGEWHEVTLNCLYRDECVSDLNKYKKAHRGKYKRYRIRELNL